MRKPRGRACVAIVGLLAAAGLARAQPAPDEAGPPGVAAEAGATEPLPPPPPAPVVRWAVDHRWTTAGPTAALVDGALAAGDLVFALDRSGAVWRRRGEEPWRVVLGGVDAAEGMDDEDLLLEAEATIEELIEAEVELDDGEQVDAEEALEPAVATATSDLDIAIQETQAQAQREAGAVGGVWVDPRQPRTIWVGRGDGLWVSRDAGERWTRVHSAPGARAFLGLGASLLVGTEAGLLRSEDDGRTWARVFPGVGSRRVHALVPAGEVLLAGTETGLYLSVDGGRWSAVDSMAGVEVTDVLVDPNWDGGLWLATAQGLLRSDDMGQSVRPASRNPLLGVRTLAHLDRPGHLLAAGADGAWESVDGGTTWAPLPDGLRGPEQPVIRARGERVELFGADGAWTLGRAPAEGAEPAPASASLGLPALGATVEQALERPGLRVGDLSVQQRVILARFAPRLKIQGVYKPRFNRTSDYLSSVTTERQDAQWALDVAFCWGLCSSSVDVIVDYDSGELYYGDLAVDRDLAVVGGQVYDFSDDTALPVAAASVAADAIEYRTAVADIVTKAWFIRRQLAVQAERVEALPLVDQVQHALAVQEVDARLDLYTDGWYGRAAAALRQP